MTGDDDDTTPNYPDSLSRVALVQMVRGLLIMGEHKMGP